jgi:hypothetical protein
MFVPNYFIKIDPKFLMMGYREHHARLLTYIANWQQWIAKKGDKAKKGNNEGKVFLSVEKIALDLNRSVATVYRWIGELNDLAINRVAETAKYTGDFFKRVFAYALSPIMPIKVEYDRETKSYTVIEPFQNSHDEKINSHDEKINSHDESPLYIELNQSANEYINPLTKVGDVVVSSSLCNTEQNKTTSSEPTRKESLVVSKPLEEGNIPAACDKTKPILSQNKDNITSTERCDYQVKLAAIGVAVQNVEWIIRQIPAQEREKVVTSAIAWVSEQKWVEQPAAAFISAVRTRKQSAAVVSEELRQIIDQNKSKVQQFAEWFDAMKTRGLVEQSISHPEHYATVLITNRAVELLARLQQETEFAELEGMTQSDRDERLAEMERVELADEVTMPSYGQPMPWQDARELLSSLTQKVILRLTKID